MVQDNDAHVLLSEVQTLLAKGAMEMVSLANRSVKFLQPLFHHSQERWWAQTHFWTQASELFAYERAVQDVNLVCAR